MATQKNIFITQILLVLSLTIHQNFLPKLLLAQITAIDISQNNSTKIRFNPPPSPPKRGTPFAEEGTGSRGNCLYKENLPPLTRLVGSSKLQLTIKEHPEFWIYVPYTEKEAPLATFSLQDGDDEIYKTSFKLSDNSGIIKISLPNNLPPLKVNNKYRWYVDIKCPNANSTKESPTPAFLTGIVTRVMPSDSLKNALQIASNTIDIIAAYAENGIWYDAFNELAQMKQQEPENPEIQQVWLELLSDENVKLTEVVSEPIIGSINK